MPYAVVEHLAVAARALAQEMPRGRLLGGVDFGRAQKEQISLTPRLRLRRVRQAPHLEARRVGELRREGGGARA